MMETWARDPDEHIRRLASEGSRPRLPWSFRLDALVADPTPAAPILDTLRTDDSPYVRKSVANHLNDITKDHPDWVLEHLKTWPLDDKRSAWIAKHALRGLIKQGNPRALSVIGATEGADVRAEHFTIAPASIRLGEAIALSTRLAETGGRAQTLVIDYAITYPKASGRASRKVFKWKGAQIAPGQRLDLSLRQTIKDFTTRKHAPGLHAVELLVNGQVVAQAAFHLSI
jgi:3-methyladenine DNA glycosylase AlkC